jgi:proteic killer suppression protein
MIKSVAGSATQRFLDEGKSKFSGMDEEVALERFAELNAATSLRELGKLSGVRLHKLKGPLSEFWSIDINGPWRIKFKFKDGDAHEVEIFDPH